MKKQVITTVLGLFLFIGAILPSSALAHETKSPHSHVTSESLVKQLELMKQRIQFLTNTQPEMEVDQETRKYFSLKIDETSVTTIYAKKDGMIVIKTDGGVGQLMLETKCSDKGALLLNGASKCLTQTWLTEYVEDNGTRTFSVPVTYADKTATSSREIRVYACRFNGCHKEEKVTINYKEKREFADDLVIKDRYEWVYDWDEKTYHVQEVLLSFVPKDVKKIQLDVQCDTKGLYIETNEDLRATCNQKRRFADYHYRELKTDSEGNKYNLVIESVTRDIQEDQVGKVALNFKFYGKNNSLLYATTHRPVQLDTLEQEDEEGEEEDN